MPTGLLVSYAHQLESTQKTRSGATDDDGEDDNDDDSKINERL